MIEKIAGVPKGMYVSEVVPSRFEEGTVYATFDGHRQNDFETYIYASHDFGQTWRSIASNLKGLVARTLTEDLKNPDVLYLGTETGLFVSLDRGKAWQRLKANLPTVRIDEITLHPRDNAMILATHGRTIWILDNLAPIQEYGGADRCGRSEALAPTPTAMFRRPASDRNYQFWGDQTFFGENPPQAAVVSWYLKNQVERVQLKIVDAAGKDVREISGPVLANSNRAGIQSACWDLRVQPAPAPAGAAGRGQGGGSGRTARRTRWRCPGAESVRAGCGGAGGGGRGGFGAAGGGNPGPFVLPGTYTVSLVIDGKTVDSKPLRVVADPEVTLTEAERKKMFDMAMEMHELQRRATEVATGMGPLNTRLAELAKEVGSKTDLPADLKASVETLQKDVAALAPKMTLPLGGGRFGGGGGGGGRGGGAGDSLVARVGQAKNGLMGSLWPTENHDARLHRVEGAVARRRSPTRTRSSCAPRTLGSALTKHSLTLTAPTPIK